MADPSPDTCELIRACCDPQNTAAWREFIRCFHKLIAGTVLRTCARWGEYSSNVADDLVQETYLKLCADYCRLLREFQHRHPNAIYGYIKEIAANIVNDHFRAIHAEKRGGGKAPEEITEGQYAAAPGQSGSSHDIEQKVLLAEVDRFLERCTQGETGQRDRLVFRLYFRQNFTAKAIAALPDLKLTVKGVESLIFRLIRCLRVETARTRQKAKAANATNSEKGFSPDKTSLQGEST